MNVIAPELENLTIKNCSIEYMNAPPGVSSFCYTDWMWYYGIAQLSKDGFHNLNKAAICLSMNSTNRVYVEKYAHKTINMLQEVHSARYLTLNVDIIECLSSFPDLVSHHPSPFSNLICLTIDSSKRSDAYKVKISTEVRNFFLGNSPNATFIMELPEKAKRAAEIDSHLMELKALIEQGNMDVDRKRAKEKANAALERLTAEMNVQVGKRVHTKTERLKAEFNICVEEMRALVKEEKAQLKAIISKEAQIRSLLDNLPKRQRTEVEAFFSRQLQETQGLHDRLFSEILASEKIFSCEKLLSDTFSTYQDDNPTPGAFQE